LPGGRKAARTFAEIRAAHKSDQGASSTPATPTCAPEKSVTRVNDQPDQDHNRAWPDA
jgi:hypothetical protein